MKNKQYSCVHSAGIFLCLALVGFFLPGYAFSEEPFYKGKTITIIQGRESGGTGDLRVKAVMPFLQKYIPGNPAIVSVYVPGGGGRKAANHIFNATRPDGLTIGNVGAGLASNAVLGEQGVEYNLEKLIYLGTSNSASQYIFMTRRALGLGSLEKLRAYQGLRIGAQAVGHDIYFFGRLCAWFLDLKNPKFVTNFSGPEVDMALMRGELDGRANIADTVVRRGAGWIEKGLLDFHVVVEIPKGEKHPSFAKLPEIETFARSTRETKLLTLQRTLRLIGSPYVLPPGTPKENVEILREALKKTFKDPAFADQFKKFSGDDPTPLTGERLEKSIREIPRDRETIDLFTKIGGTEPLPSR